MASFCLAQAPIGPHSAFEPPAAKAAASLAASTAASPKDLLTTGEKTDFNETAPYAEAVEISRRLEKQSRAVKVIDMGTTPEGRTMIALIVSKDRAFTPAEAARTGKVVVLIQSGIHAGEIEGKDPVLMLIRDMTMSKKYAAWLDTCIFVIVPVFNVDGHESFSPYHRVQQNGPRSTGLRATAQRLNLNRDYIKGDQPEMRAWLRLFNAWMPDFHIDNHVTDGADFQYDVTWDMARNQDIAEPARTWVNAKFVPELNRRMEADGHMVAPYGALRNVSGKREFFMEVFSPRYSHLYAAVQNRPSLLVETHSLKNAKTRAWAHYDIMRHSIETIAADPEALRKAVRDADREMSVRAGDRSAPPVYLAGKVSDKSRPLVYHSLRNGPFKSEITGAMVNRYLPDLDDIPTVIHDQIDTTAEAQMPLGYLIPAAWKDIADLLALHGVEMERTKTAVEKEFETYRFSNTKFTTQSFEGRVMLNFDAKLVKEKIAIHAGSYWVPMRQRRARLILAMLEPSAPDSLAKWGFMNAVFEGREGAGDYIVEPVARRMMADSPELRGQFEARLAADAAFAADPRARLQWWFERSKYEAGDTGRYPIIRVWEADPLPGRALAEHPFLYCGEWQDKGHSDQIMHLVRDGKVEWTYSIPGKEEYGDCTRLSNGNIVFSRRLSASEVTPDKKIVWHYDAPPKSEIHTAYPIGKDRVMILQNGDPAKLLVIEKATNKVVTELVLPTRNPAGAHGQFRHARYTKAGTFLVAHMDLGKVVEYSPDGKELWSVAAPSAWAAVRLKNGNTLISGNQHGYVREVNPKGETVWEIGKNDLPGYPLYTVQEVDRLANGNTVICNWAGSLPQDQWPSTVQVIEVTPDKKVVWALRDWKTLGPASSIQLLDEKGVPENGDLQR